MDERKKISHLERLSRNLIESIACFLPEDDLLVFCKLMRRPGRWEFARIQITIQRAHQVREWLLRIWPANPKLAKLARERVMKIHNMLTAIHMPMPRKRRCFHSPDFNETTAFHLLMYAMGSSPRNRYNLVVVHPTRYSARLDREYFVSFCRETFGSYPSIPVAFLTFAEIETSDALNRNTVLLVENHDYLGAAGRDVVLRRASDCRAMFLTGQLRISLPASWPREAAWADALPKSWKLRWKE